ncbi:hypothetical protein [Streptomyces iranensis]|uniref:Lipoprotein n=1 Tax=Streptomyces iranensis TaxID=576784 RepID=A0A060ZUZ8_9ACTN|nr:hypothetical protein [Streptomyces iranensis]MBP2065096.1 hypothetical protein [Streptomyces iranensis]CDR09955.1 predicted protein [Streptomyces iranensis]
MSSNTIAHTVRRRTLRVAAAVLIAAAGFSLTACNDSDANASKPAASAASSSADSSTGTKSSDAKADTGAGTEDKAGAADEAASPDRTETLADGSTAEIYELGDQHYRLKMVNDGDVLATFEANGEDAGLDANGMYVVLTMGGEVQSWMGGEHQAPGTFEIAGDFTAKVTKVGESHYRAQIIGNGDVMATMEANGHDAGLDANGVYIVLSTRGAISAHE